MVVAALGVALVVWRPWRRAPEPGELPEEAMRAYEQGCSMLELGRTAEALELLERASSLAPRSPEILHALGGARLRAGRAEPAYQALSRAYEMDPTPGCARDLAAALANLGRYREAAEFIAPLAERRDLGPDIDMELGFFLLMDARPQAALPPLTRFAEHAPRAERVFALIAQAQQALGDIPRAIEAVSRFVEQQPSFVEHRRMLLDLRASLTGRTEVTRLAESILAQDPADGLARYDLAYARRAEPAGALGILEPLLTEGPLAEESRILAANLLVRAGRPAEALRTARLAEERGLSPIRVGEPAILLALGDLPSAGECWQQARLHFPRVAATHRGMAEAQAYLGDGEAACRTLEEGMGAGLDAFERAVVLEALGYARLDAGNPETAREAFRSLGDLGAEIPAWRHRALRGEALASVMLAGRPVTARELSDWLRYDATTRVQDQRPEGATPPAVDLAPAREILDRAIDTPAPPDDLAYTLLWAGFLAAAAGDREMAQAAIEEIPRLPEPLDVAVPAEISRFLLGTIDGDTLTQRLGAAGPAIAPYREIARGMLDGARDPGARAALLARLGDRTGDLALIRPHQRCLARWLLPWAWSRETFGEGWPPEDGR